MNKILKVPSSEHGWSFFVRMELMVSAASALQVFYATKSKLPTQSPAGFMKAIPSGNSSKILISQAHILISYLLPDLCYIVTPQNNGEWPREALNERATPGSIFPKL